MFGLGGSEILLIALVALLVFGPQRIPEIARNIKHGYDEWRKVRSRVDETLSELRQQIDLKLDPAGEAAPSAPVRQSPAPPVETAPTELPVPSEDDYLATGGGSAAPAAEEDYLGGDGP